MLLSLLEIIDLCVTIEDKPILKQFSLSIKKNEVHAIMGPNGAGKSTLAKVLSGHPSYAITSGKIFLNGEDILALEPEERAQKGLFMSFQYPVEISGVSNRQFLKSSVNSIRKAKNQPELKDEQFELLLDSKMRDLDMKQEFKERNVNEGFSGGEKKRNEILQMAMLDPQLVVLDEIDSGLDIDAMKVVANGINQLKTSENSWLLITHYQRLLDYIQPDFVHVMIEGKIVKSGKADLALELEEKGYDWLLPNTKAMGNI